MIDGQREASPDRVRFAATGDIERLLADTPDVRAALLEEGVPGNAFRVAADAQLTVLHSNDQFYIRFATARNGDPVAVELPSGRVVEMVTRRHPPESIIHMAIFQPTRRDRDPPRSAHAACRLPGSVFAGGGPGRWPASLIAARG